MRAKRALAAALAALLIAALAGCGAQVHEYAPDLDDMIFIPDGGVQDDGTVIIHDDDVPTNDDPESADPAIAQVLELINAQREAQDLDPLKTLPELDKAAAVRADELIVSFAHVRPDGSKFRTALEEQGIDAGYFGENAAKGQRTPEQLVNGWMNSEGHKQNILRSEYVYAGVGHSVDSATGYNYWVLVLISEPRDSD